MSKLVFDIDRPQGLVLGLSTQPALDVSLQTDTLSVGITQPQALSLGLSQQQPFDFSIRGSAISSEMPEYTGSIDIIPSEEVQVLATSEHCLHRNIIVEAIPSNYGLITYTGSGIIVS